VQQRSATRSAGLPERGLGHLLREISRSFENEMQGRLARYGVTLSQWLHLRSLWDNPGMTCSAVSRYLGVEKASSTAVLDDLEGKGLIQRVKNTEDRRIVNLQLTAQGKSLTRKLIPQAVQINSAARANVGANDFLTFLRVAETMVENLKNMDSSLLRPGKTSNLARK
jgi:DNA-binding MarR family transcriptional regulator